MSGPSLDTVIASVARVLPSDQVQALAVFLDEQQGATKSNCEAMRALIPTAGFATQSAMLGKAWLTDPTVPGAALALALRATALAAERARHEQRVSTVWTGPTSSELPLRQTLGVLIQVIRAAKERLLIVSFAAYKIADVVDALHEAATRGVTIAVVVDEQTDASKAFARLGADASLYCWPDAGKVLPNGAKVRMHVKAAVADDHTALVGSANLTGQALSENMELGLLVEGGDTPRRLDAHFRRLIAEEVLVSLAD